MSGEDRTLDEQISEMIDNLSTGEVEEEAGGEEVVEETPKEVVEETAKEEKVDETTAEPESVVEEQEVEELIEERPEAETETQEAPAAEEPSEEVKSLRTQVNALAKAALEQGVQLDFKALGVEIEEAPKETPAVETPAVIPATQTSQASYDNFKVLMEGVSFESFMENEETFNQGMVDILKRHEDMLSQKFLTYIPGVVQNQVKMYATLQRATDKFYETNEDLQEVKPTVGAVANQLAAKNPSWTVNKVMEESAKITRKILRMPSPSLEKKKGGRVVNPSFAKSRGQSPRTKPKQQMSKLQQEIDELLN